MRVLEERRRARGVPHPHACERGVELERRRPCGLALQRSFGLEVRREERIVAMHDRMIDARLPNRTDAR